MWCERPLAKRFPIAQILSPNYLSSTSGKIIVLDVVERGNRGDDILHVAGVDENLLDGIVTEKVSV